MVTHDGPHQRSIFSISRYLHAGIGEKIGESEQGHREVSWSRAMVVRHYSRATNAHVEMVAMSCSVFRELENILRALCMAHE